MTAAHQHPDLRELVDQLNPAQADAVRAVVVQFVTPGANSTMDHTAADNGKPEPPRQRLSFAGTLSAEPDLAERVEEILDEIVRRNAGRHRPTGCGREGTRPSPRRCAVLLETHPGPVAVPAPVIVEVCRLLASRRGTRAEAAFLAALGAGELDVITLAPDDYTRAAQLVEQYADLPLGAVDACVIAVTERLGVTEIATLDQRHFTVVRPRHVEAFTLLP